MTIKGGAENLADTTLSKQSLPQKSGRVCSEITGRVYSGMSGRI